jgi:hypothetical protein
MGKKNILFFLLALLSKSSGCLQIFPANIRQGQNGLLGLNTGPGVNKPDKVNGASLR